MSRTLIELLIEAAMVVAFYGLAYVIGWRRVKLINLPEDQEYLIAPPARKKDNAKSALSLRKEYSKRNKLAKQASSTMIVLPSNTFNYVFGGVFGLIMGSTLVYNHIWGATDFMDPMGQEVLAPIIALLGLFMTGIIGVGFVVGGIIMPAAEEAKARRIAEARLFRGRTAIFGQGLSFGEFFAYALWAIKENRAEKKAACK